MQHTTLPAGPVPASGPAHAEDVAQILLAASRGDQHAWDELVARYSGMLWAVVRSYRLGADDAADVIQTTWLRLIEHLSTLRNPDGLGSWLATTARRECLRALRGGDRCRPSEVIEELPDEDAESLDAGLLAADRAAALRTAFGRLPASDQTVLRLLAAEPALSYAEIGAALGRPIGSIGPTRARVLERLRGELRRAGALADVPARSRS